MINSEGLFMSAGLSPENEAFLAALVASHEFANREAALDSAVDLLRRRRELKSAIAAGVRQLESGESRQYNSAELDRFLADVEGRERELFRGK
jgi:Arc/MetJ-type ribon-helix-helix transcriptional regulator